MHILVQCPRCQSRYQLEDNLRGQMVRCPSSICGQIFKVPDLTAPVPPATPPTVQEGGRTPPPLRGPGRPGAPAPGKQVSGSVGGMIPLLGAESVNKGPQPTPGNAPRSSGRVEDIVPVLPAEAVSPPPPAPRDAPSWQQQSPPVRNANAPMAKARPPLSPPPAPPPPPAPARAEPAPEGTDWRQQPPPRQAGGGNPPRPSAPPPAASPPRPQPARASTENASSKPAKASNETMRIPPARGPAETVRVERGAETQPARPSGPVELGPGSWDAPPVRRSGGAFGSEPLSGPEHEVMPAVRAKRRARWILAGLALVVGGLIGATFFFVRGAGEKKEENRFEQAETAYQNDRFVEAAQQFRALEKDYPRSSRRAAYKFYAELSEVRQPAYILQATARDMNQAYRQVLHFAREHQNDELLKKRRGDIGDTLYKLAEQMADRVKNQGDRDLLPIVREVLAEARKYKEDREAERKAQELEEGLAAAARAAETRKKRKQLLARLKKLARQPSGDAVQRVRALLQREGREHPDLAEDPTVVGILNRLADAHRARVKYTPARAAPPARAPEEDSEPSLLVAPAIGGLGFKPWPRQSPVLALARGVLYALRPSDGSVRWATRVGVDTTVLPARLPAHKATPELILVPSSDTRTLSALDAVKGSAVWHHRLTAPCLGRPTVVGRRIYVPCFDGRVDEVDAATGKLLGSYDLGQRLRLGGAYDEDSGLLYLPADSFCVYALDLARQRCAGILYSQHASGSLRGEPLILHWKDVDAEAPRNPDSPRSCLLFSQAVDLATTELHAFQLPILNANAVPLKLNLRVRGWSWFPPVHDDEKLALVTDAGVLGLFGIKQKNNRDKPLYPLRKREFVLEKSEDAGQARQAGRAQLVHVDESNFWALANGELHRLQIRLGPTGWKKTELWGTPLALGSPLHAGQVDPARKILFLVTRPETGQTCQASAVRAEADSDDKDKLKWQTQLGLVCQAGNLVALKDAVLVQDQRGGLFRFDAGQYQGGADAAWLIHEQLAANPLDEDGATPLHLLPIPGGAIALVRTGNPTAGKLVLRHFDAAKNKTTEYPLTLAAPLTGTPGAWTDHLVFPMGNGILMRKQLGGGPPVLGPNWRAERADDNAPGYVVPLNTAEFLVSDGSRSLLRLSWPKDDDNCKEKTRKKLPARVVSPPVVLFSAPGNSEFRVLVADADDHVTLFQGDLKTDPLEMVRRLPLGGKITAGPFPLGKGVGCVVDHRRLVLLDPEKNRVKWSHDAGAEIVGRPAVVGKLLVVADLEGNFVSLDPVTGERRGQGYKLKANVAPAAAPLAFGAERVFAPLTDGTVLLLSVTRLQAPARAKKDR